VQKPFFHLYACLFVNEYILTETLFTGKVFLVFWWQFVAICVIVIKKRRGNNMQLSELLRGFTYTCEKGPLERDVTAVINDSRKACGGCLFLCIVGARFDGHEKAAEALEKGAKVLVVCRSLPEEALAGRDVTVIRVEDTRYAMAFISAAWFGHPAERLTVIGVTGTKGKTTTTYLMKSILEHAGHKVGLVGTIETQIGEERIPAHNTTPESYTLQEYFARMVEAGCDTVVMEVSSQGLMLHRTQGFVFDYGIFTNLEPDHIGPNEHASMEEYIACKGLLFKQCRTGIANRDSEYFEQVMEGHTCKLETFGLEDAEADLRASDIRLLTEKGKLGVSFHVDGLLTMDAEISTPGRFSVYNALTAIALCRHFEVPEQTIREALLNAHVRGRIEPVKVSDDYTLLIDYAHNAMALESLLTTLKEYHPNRLVCMFGCGGNRSRLRRYEMGEVSGKLADLTVITSDNPRDEEPQAIIDDIKAGIGRTEGAFVEICDRKEAIRYCMTHAQPGDIVVLAGKGHEDYQEIKGVYYPMDERVLIQEILQER